MLNFKILKVYEMDDIEFGGDAMEVRLLNLDKPKIANMVMSGDYYHNKINDRIEGFFEGLDYLGVKYTTVEEKINEKY